MGHFSRRCSAAALLIAALTLAGCRGHGTEPGDVLDMTVTGTDGRSADPAEISALQNLGNFTVGFHIQPASGLYAVLIARNSRNEEIQLADLCCGSCAASAQSCQYDAANGVSCGTGNRKDLMSFFQDSGGLPNKATLVVKTVTKQCYEQIFDGIFDFSKTQHDEAVRGVTFR